MARARIVAALYHEGWKDADAAAHAGVAQIVGDGDVKNWSCLIVPDGTELARELAENPRIAALEARATMEVAKVAPAKPIFPLVAIEYERDFYTESFTVAGARAERGFVIERLEALEVRVRREDNAGEG
jgi:hypothetical protein